MKLAGERPISLATTMLNPIPRKAALLAFAAVTAVACRDLTAPLPRGATPLQAQPPYAFWWQMTESCSGRTGDFSTIRWFVVPGADSFEVSGKHYNGYWYGNNSIVIASRHVLDGQLVRHEMLHALTGGPHSRQFLDACGGVVACQDECLTEAGGLPVLDSTTVELPVSSLRTELQMEPADPSLSTDGGWVALSVMVHTPQDADVRALLTAIPGDPSFSATFGYDIASCHPTCTSVKGTYSFMPATLYDFTLGATRRYVFDVQLPPGTYSARGVFNVDSTAAATFSVGP